MPDPDEIKVVRVSLPGISDKAKLVIRSSGDNTDFTSFTPNNSGIQMVDKNGVEVFRIWTDGTNGGDLYIGSQQPTATLGGSNTAVGGNNMSSGTTANGNSAFGNGALRDLTIGNANTALAELAGYRITTGTGNTCIGYASSPAEPTANDIVLVGENNQSSLGVTNNAIAVGVNILVSTDNTAVFGNGSITDVYFGSDDGISASAIMHGKGDAIVFPDSDPHIVGAGYWVAGVLTRSNG